MRTLTSILAAGLLACSMSAIAADSTNSNGGAAAGRDSATTSGNTAANNTPSGEYGNECAWGLANEKHVETNCSVNMTRENGKTYCFSNDKAMAAFMKDPSKNMEKAEKTYGRS